MSRKKVCLLPRLALSDLIAINGLVRTLCAESDDVMVVAKRDHVGPIRSLYGDVPSLRFKFVDSWSSLHSPDGGVLSDAEKAGYTIVPLPSFRQSCPYALVGLHASLARTAFVMRRSQDQENALLRRVRDAVGQTFVVVHDDTRRIRRDLLPRGYATVSVRDPAFRTPNIFDWIAVIDNAVQLHGVDSCFMLMADYLALKARKYVHTYADTCRTANAKYSSDVVLIFS